MDISEGPTQEAGVVTVTWLPDDEWLGELTVQAAAHRFAGESKAWFDKQTVFDFARALSAYPLPSDGPVTLASGFGASAAELEQEHVALRLEPVGRKGQISVQVHLATPRWPETRLESICDVRLELLTTYEQLSRFAVDLPAVIHGYLPHASLTADVLT